VNEKGLLSLFELVSKNLKFDFSAAKSLVSVD
jgi:hypothetical protein